MCGLFFSSNIPDPLDEFISNVKAFIQHRGIFKPRIRLLDNMLFAHSLLPVQGDKAIHQPLISENNCLIFSGEIWAHKGQKSDTLFLFDALLNSSDITKTVCNLKGMFAFVYYCHITKSIYFASDVFGEIPLYYSWENTTLIVASEIKQIIAVGLNFKDVSPALPGMLYHYSLTDDVLKSSNYHSWAFHNNIDVLNKTKLRRIIRESIKEKYETIDLQKSALLLSGGLDSAILAYELSRLGLKETFTVSAVENGYDLITAERVCNRFGLIFNPIIANHLKPSCAITVTEINNRSIIEEMCCHLILANHISKKNVRVVFSGCGADEIFIGYQHLLRYRSRVTRQNLQEEFITNYYKMDLRAFNKAYMLNAIEIRNPYLSPKLVEYASTLDVESLLVGRGRKMKVALRLAYENILKDLALQPKLIARETMGAKQIFLKHYGESPYIYKTTHKEIFNNNQRILEYMQEAKTLT